MATRGGVAVGCGYSSSFFVCVCGYMLWVRLYGKGEAVAPPFLRESQQVTLGAALSTADYNIKITPPLSEEVADMPQGRGTNHWAYQRLTHYIIV